jgi:SAM-dependent methyltransferase
MSFASFENMAQASAFTTEFDLATYAAVASEYYDAARHPTCANFREASSLYIRPRLFRVFEPASLVCEVGTGKSLVAELYEGSDLHPRQLILTDIAADMLEHSRHWAKADVTLCVSDARTLPFGDNQFELLVSSLGDPYNDRTFWSETARVLKRGGHCFFTTPAYDWATTFRSHGDVGDFTVAEFETRSGRSVRVPSLILHPHKQIEMIEQSGLCVIECVSVPIEHLKGLDLSPKLCAARRGLSEAVIDGYHIIKER